MKSLRNLPLDENFNIILDGKPTNIPGVDPETKKLLLWEKRGNISYATTHRESERSSEYF